MIIVSWSYVNNQVTAAAAKWSGWWRAKLKPRLCPLSGSAWEGWERDGCKGEQPEPSREALGASNAEHSDLRARLGSQTILGMEGLGMGEDVTFPLWTHPPLPLGMSLRKKRNRLEIQSPWALPGSVASSTCTLTSPPAAFRGLSQAWTPHPSNLQISKTEWAWVKNPL